MAKPRVVLRRCRDYDIGRLTGIIRETLNDLQIVPQGRIFIKPNVVCAHKKHNRNGYTRPEVVEAMVRTLGTFQTESISIGEAGGFGMPTRMFLKAAGYFKLARKTGVDLFDLHERGWVKRELTKGICHRTVMVPRNLLEANFKIWMPKLKFHSFAGITHAIKLNIGLLHHKERLMYHDYRVHEKIVDLLEIGYPDFIVSDAIEIAYGAEAAPYGHHLGVLLLADDPVAADAVAAYLMGYQPEEIEHLKIASGRGYGSIKLNDIQLGGDADVDEFRAKPKGDRRLFQTLSDLATPVHFYAGAAPDGQAICEGGCQGALKGCLGMIERYFPSALMQAKDAGVVTGLYNGDVLQPGQPVVLVGDCTAVIGRISADKVYRIKGCPTSTRDLLGSLSLILSLPNPSKSFRDRFCFILNRLESWVVQLNNLFSRFILRKFTGSEKVLKGRPKVENADQTSICPQIRKNSETRL